MKTEWNTKKLADLCDISIGKTPSRSEKKFWDNSKSSRNIWLSIADLSKTTNREVLDSAEYVSDQGASLFKIVPKGTLLVSFKLTLGRLAFAGCDLRTNEAIAALHNSESEVLNEYLYYYLLFFDWDEYASADHKVKGKTLNKEKIKKIPVFFPDKSEQKKIVEVLDKKSELISQLIQTTSEQISEVEDLFVSQMKELFEKVLNSVEFKKFGDVADFVRGPFGGSLKKVFFKPEGYAVYEQQHAIYDQFTDIRYFVDEKKFAEMKRFEVFPGDLIMSCSGTIGKTAIVPEGVKRGIINQALLKLTPHKDLLDVRYMQWWMKSSLFDEEIKANSGGAAISNVASVKVLKEIMVPVPSLSKQKSIVKELDNYLQKKNDLIEIFKKKQDDLIELKKSYLQEAFAGKL